MKNDINKGQRLVGLHNRGYSKHVYVSKYLCFKLYLYVFGDSCVFVVTD